MTLSIARSHVVYAVIIMLCSMHVCCLHARGLIKRRINYEDRRYYSESHLWHELVTVIGLVYRLVSIVGLYNAISYGIKSSALGC